MKKRFLLSIVAAVLSTVALHADLVLVQKVDNHLGMNGEISLKIKGDSVRMDMGNDVSVVLDGATGSITSIIHAQKTYLTMEGDSINQMMKAVAAQNKDKKAGEVKLVPTGKTEVINGQKAEVFNLEGAPYKGTFWIARDYPNAAGIQAALKRIQELPMNRMAAEVAPQPKDIPGVPVKTEIEIAPGQKVTTELVSVKEENLDPALFKAPEGYKAMQMPAMPPQQ